MVFWCFVVVFEILVAFLQHHDWKKAFHQVIPLRKQAKDAPSQSIPTPQSPLSTSSGLAATTCQSTSSSVTTADGSTPGPPQSNLATSSDVEEHLSASQVDADLLTSGTQTVTHKNTRQKVIGEPTVTSTVEFPVVSCSKM